MTSLKHEIGSLIGEIDDNVKNGRDMRVGDQRLMASRLKTLGRLAGNIEQELAVLRLSEAGRQGRLMVDQLALDQFEGLARDPEGKVVRPDFGKGGRP